MTTTHEPDGQSAHGAVVVAVDGSEYNGNAIAWAADEAARIGDRLLLLAATGELITPVPHVPAAGWVSEYPERARRVVRRISTRLEHSHPGVTTESSVQLGEPSSIILKAIDGADLVVLGQRGLGGFERMLVGSTSIAVAGRSSIPAVVVPDDWDAVSMDGTIVVGIDPSHTDEQMLRMAFARAQSLGVPLTVVFAWRALPLFDWSPADLAEWSDQAGELLDELLEQWRDEFSDVDVVAVHPRAHPAGALLDVAKGAQLVIVGRRSGAHHVGGFGVGSVTRAVLHYAPCPVMVVPSHKS